MIAVSSSPFLLRSLFLLVRFGFSLIGSEKVRQLDPYIASG